MPMWDDDAWQQQANPKILDTLYETSPALVACSILALEASASDMDRSGRSWGLEVLGPEGAETFGDSWDVLQNYAEQHFPEEHPVFGPQPLSREIIDQSFDPAVRVALGEWATQNPELLDTEAPSW